MAPYLPPFLLSDTVERVRTGTVLLNMYLTECPRIEESLQDSVSTLVKTSSWGTGTTTSTTSGNCPRKSDGCRERDFESLVQAPLMPAYSLFARTQACVLKIHSFSRKRQDKKIAPRQDCFLVSKPFSQSQH
jgi:hypothetical protein